MTANRRDFIKTSAAATGVLGFGLAGCGSLEESSATDTNAQGQQARPMNILILGGTGFIGPHMVERARARGHTVSIFNRGKTNPDLFPKVELLVGDRDGQLDALIGREWDAVIDNSGYVPRHVRDSAQLLKGAVNQYLFISSVSAYGSLEQIGIDEDHPLGTMEDETVEEVTGETYGPMKALCEKAVAETFPGAMTIVRPGYIVGPGDSTDRWTYWPVRIARGGEVLAPGDPADPIQIIDARDLAAFVVNCLENKTLGTYNAVGPASTLEMGDMLERINAATGSMAEFTWVDAEKLQSSGAVLPIWSPPAGPYAGIHLVSNARAIEQGLSFRPLEDTIRDTLAWWDSLDDERRSKMRSGLRIPPEFGSEPASLETQLEHEAKLLAKARPV